jgi:LysR family glycine cleavage system transcriptional activator
VIYRLPPLNALRVFEAAARHLSFKEAAVELHITQAAVSHQVKSLEEYLGVQLFRRGRRAPACRGCAKASTRSPRPWRRSASAAARPSW